MTFYFYDLETSGINSRAQRIMQFAGQRTDENLEPIGESHNWLIKLTDEILPDPEAILITGITPQKTLEEGYSEAEFLELFESQVLQPETVVTGFNNVRFDDEFIRNTLWRNFYDPYAWQWQDNRSRWDLLDVVRMMRALRPDGINWPVGKSGQPTNRLELLTKENNLNHDNAHDALSDVNATIAIAKLLKQKQPKMFNYLLKLRDKKQVSKVVNLNEASPFVYTSGRYSTKWQKTTVVVSIANAEFGGILVYDLRQDPNELASLSDEQLVEQAFSRDPETEVLAIKTLKPNKCPAIAPLGVFDKACQKRLDLSIKTVETNWNKLHTMPKFIERIKILNEQKQDKFKNELGKTSDPDLQIYDGFINDSDKKASLQLRQMQKDKLVDFSIDFSDERLAKLLSRYKARNFSKSLNSNEREMWEDYRKSRILNGIKGQLSLKQFATKLSEFANQNKADDKQYLLQELTLWAESIAPLE